MEAFYFLFGREEKLPVWKRICFLWSAVSVVAGLCSCLSVGQQELVYEMLACDLRQVGIHPPSFEACLARLDENKALLRRLLSQDASLKAAHFPSFADEI